MPIYGIGNIGNTKPGAQSVLASMGWIFSRDTFLNAGVDPGPSPLAGALRKTAMLSNKQPKQTILTSPLGQVGHYQKSERGILGG